MTDPRMTPRFNGYEPPGGPTFDRSRTQLSSGFFQRDFDLAAAGDVFLDLAGDFLYVDTDPVNSNGFATLQMNVQQDAGAAKFYIGPGFAIEQTFYRLRLTWSAQAGKKLRLLFSTGDRVVPANTGAISIVGTVPINDAYAGSAVAVQETGTANGVSNIFPAGSNPNGMYVNYGAFAYRMTPSTTFCLFHVLAKATSPSGSNDGVLIMAPDFIALTGTDYQLGGRRDQRIYIPAGVGLWAWREGTHVLGRCLMDLTVL